MDGHPLLEQTRHNLALRGLKDPWLRNEVGRYDNYRGITKTAMVTVTRGMKWAALATVITIAANKALGISASKGDHH